MISFDDLTMMACQLKCLTINDGNLLLLVLKLNRDAARIHTFIQPGTTISLAANKSLLNCLKMQNLMMLLGVKDVSLSVCQSA